MFHDNTIFRSTLKIWLFQWIVNFLAKYKLFSSIHQVENINKQPRCKQKTEEKGLYLQLRLGLEIHILKRSSFKPSVNRKPLYSSNSFKN